MTILCNKCEKYSVSQDGTRETCKAKHEGSKFIIWMTDQYIDQRMTGEKQFCKGFKRIKP